MILRLLNSIQFRLFASLGLLATVLVVVIYVNADLVEKSGETQDAIDAAGSLRSDSYLLASLARRYSAADALDVQQSLSGAIGATIDDFERYHTGLIEGDPSLELVPINAPEILPLLSELDRQWETYRADIESLLTGDPIQQAESLVRIERQSVNVYTFADRITNALDVLLDERVRTAQQLTLVLGLAGGLAVLFAIYVIVQTVRSVRGLSHAAQAFAGGNRKARADVRTLNEIGETGRVFNVMAGEIEQLVQDLQGQVREAQTAQQRAERSDRVKSAFLASMSHELRTPLNAIINFTRFILDGDTGTINEQQEELLTDVVTSGKHLLNLINDVLDMSKIEAGSLNLFIEDNISVTGIVNQVANTGQGLLKGKSVHLEVETDPDLPPIRADRQRILQILLNLMSNACKFTEQGEIKLSASTSDGNVVIKLQDTGVGISPEDHDSVFDAFKQTQSGLRQGGGTGLGLPIARSLAEAHGGRLWFDSEPGKGSTFYVTLPVKSDVLVPAL